MSTEVELAEMRKDLEHILKRLDARDEKDEDRDRRLDQLFEMFTLGRSISSMFVKLCVAIGTVATAAFFVVEKIIPHIAFR
jgi:hypothetical protein